MARLKRGEEITLDIEKFADRGKSIARLDGYVVFVPGGVPGDRLKVRIVKSKKKFAEAVPLEVLEPSAQRTDPVCAHFGSCGGCKWQHVEYAAQLEAKRASVAEALEHHGGIAGLTVEPTIGSAAVYGYRNKMEFSFGAERWLTSGEIASGKTFDTSFALGLHTPGNFRKVVDIAECHLHPELGNRLLSAVRRFSTTRGWKPWNVRDHTGYLRHLVLRFSSAFDDVMVNLVTSGYDEERAQVFADFLREDFPEVTTLVNTINSSVAQTAFGEQIHTIFGSGVVKDRIGDYTFELAANAFFQTNTRQAEALYEVAAEYAGLMPDDLVFDLYCGAGTISIYLAKRVRQVIGVELVAEAVENARRNALANNVTNADFIAGDMLKIFRPEFMDRYGRPDVLIVDPPRAGMHPKVAAQIARLKVDRFVYVSCNPLSQARDLAALDDAYRIEAVQPVDLFPHTHHVENVVKLRAR